MSYNHPSLDGHMAKSAAHLPCNLPVYSDVHGTAGCLDAYLSSTTCRRGNNKLAGKAVMEALEKAMGISASSTVTDKQNGILTAHVAKVATSLLSSATQPCGAAVQGAALLSAAPHNVIGVLEGAPTATAGSRVTATKLGAAEPQRLALGEVAVSSAVAAGYIQPVRYTLKSRDLPAVSAKVQCYTALASTSWWS
jgi:hypothetical protein